jgi:hypothetical protein
VGIKAISGIGRVSAAVGLSALLVLSLPGRVVQIEADEAPPVVPAPVNTVAPLVTGIVRIDQVLSCTAGTWTDAASYTYQWYRSSGPSWAAIAGATAATYTVVAADMPAQLRCEVVASGPGGTSAPASSNAVASPLKPIWDLDPNAAIWVRTAGWSVSVGSPEGAWATADGRWTWTQASTSLKPTRTTTGLGLDGVDDWMSCDSLAARCDGAHTMIIGWTQGSEGATPARTIWCVASDDSGGSTYQVSLNYSRPDAVNATRMSGRWAAGTGTLVTVSLVSLGSKGAGPYLLAQVSGAQGSAARVVSLDTPLVEVGSLTRPAGTTTHEWLTLGARRLGAGPTVSQPWLGTIHSVVLLTLAASDAQLAAIRAALAAEDAL